MTGVETISRRMAVGLEDRLHDRQIARGQNIIFINKYFYPDHSATSQMLTDLAAHLAASGDSVSVLTSTQRYDDPQARLPAEEQRFRVSISRLATTKFGRTSVLGRVLDYLSFYRSAWRAIRRQAKRDDILVVKTDPPLLCVIAMLAARGRGIRLVNWLQDLYPEVAIEIGVPFLKGPVAAVLTWLRDAALRSAHANVVISEQMAQRLRARGIASERIHVVPNWCDDEDIEPAASRDNPLRRDWALENRFVIGYSGNLGAAHEFETVLEAAEQLREHSELLFLFIGGGSKFDELVRRVTDRGLERNFRFLPYQRRSALKHTLTLPDIHLISLKPRFEGLILPSKFYGIAAAGRPMIAVADRKGELAQLILRNGCGAVVPPGDAAELAATILRLSQDQRSCAEMGRRARTMLDTQFTQQQAFDRWRFVLENIA